MFHHPPMDTELIARAGDNMQLRQRVRVVTETLESIGADWTLLDQLPPEERERLHKAIAALHSPDRIARRRRQKEARQEKKATEAKREEEVLHRTGIRTLRRKPVFTTPNVFPPSVPLKNDLREESAEENVSRRHCYVCKVK